MGFEATDRGKQPATAGWQKDADDRRVARKVVIFLEGRRLLFGDRHVEDEGECIGSALQIRAFLTEQITDANPGMELERALRVMRTACRKFVEIGGPNGRNFHRSHYPYEADGFSLALGDLRTAIGYQLGSILADYPMDVEPELASILPGPDDDGEELDWASGHGR